MAKLKFDRSINFMVEKNETITVPTDEVWKVTAHEADRLCINGEKATMGSSVIQPFAYTIGGGY